MDYVRLAETSGRWHVHVQQVRRCYFEPPCLALKRHWRWCGVCTALNHCTKWFLVKNVKGGR
jgi:hypothetical protein